MLQKLSAILVILAAYPACQSTRSRCEDQFVHEYERGACVDGAERLGYYLFTQPYGRQSPGEAVVKKDCDITCAATYSADRINPRLSMKDQAVMMDRLTDSATACSKACVIAVQELQRDKEIEEAQRNYPDHSYLYFP